MLRYWLCCIFSFSKINPRNIKHVILTGHDPIWGAKNKGRDTDEFTPLLESGIHFIMDIYNLFVKAKKYYRSTFRYASP